MPLGPLTIERSPSGTLHLGSTQRDRATGALLAILLAGFLCALAWLGTMERKLSWPQTMLLAGLLIGIFFLAGGAQAVRVALGERYAFDPRRRTVRRNGRDWCRYGDIEELRIMIWVRRHGVHEYRLQLVLRGARTEWLGVSLVEIDQGELNELAHAIASELGVAVRVMR
jgi:hypothetical protein